MKIKTSYTSPIKEQLYINGKDRKLSSGSVDASLMENTADICFRALKLCVDIFTAEWDYLSKIPTTLKKGQLSRKRAADILIHSTKGSPARYPEFDKLATCMPAYVRRAVIADALGIVSSYMSNHRNWENTPANERGSEPVPGLPERYELTFYEQERDLCDMDKGVIGLKLFNGKTWNWYFFRIPASDARYINKVRCSRRMLSPVVERIHGKYYIRFSFEEIRDLVQNTDPLSYTILSVDLGINAPASWSVMLSDGTVPAKGVIHLPREEDRLRHLINRKRMYQQAGKKAKSIYRMVKDANKQLSIETCKAIMETAAYYNADCIVFEHLERSSAKGKRYKERIHMWRSIDVQKRVELQAHRCGMRISRVCAWGTSRLAFDGSGPVKRDKDNYSVCSFQNGKTYNCDLSASLNIGARYFLREYAKLKDCPELPKTPQRTYSTLRGLIASKSAA